VGGKRQKQADQIADLVRESVAHVDQIAPEAMRAILPAIRDAREELQTGLGEWLAKENGAERFTTYKLAHAQRSLEGALERIREMEPAMAEALGAGAAATGPIAMANLDREVIRLGQIFGESLRPPQIDTAAVIARGDRLLYRRHASSAERYAGQIGEDLRHQLAVGVVKGESIAQVSQRMARLSGGMQSARNAQGMDAHAIADAMGTRWRYAADRLVRTETMHAYNVQHDEALRAMAADPAADPADEWLRRWDATADVAACDACKALDRMAVPIGGTFPGGYSAPPLHPHCRCVLVAWLARWGGIKGEVPARGDDGRKQIERSHDPVADAAAKVPARAKRTKKEPAAVPDRALAVPARVKLTPEQRAADRAGKAAARADAAAAARAARAAAADAARAAEKAARADAKAAEKAAAKAAKPLSKTAQARAEAKQRAADRKQTRETIEAMKAPKNPLRQAAAKKAGEASQERRREIASTARSNLTPEMQTVWDKEGRKFSKENAWRTEGLDAVNAGSKLSEAFNESYGGGGDTAHGNEGDRHGKRMEIVAEHAEHWADSQTEKHYAEAERQAKEHGEVTEWDEWGVPIRRSQSHEVAEAHHEARYEPPKVDDDDPPF
jgi:hypothetical protein